MTSTSATTASASWNARTTMFEAAAAAMFVLTWPVGTIIVVGAVRLYLKAIS